MKLLDGKNRQDIFRLNLHIMIKIILLLILVKYFHRYSMLIE